MKLNFQCLESLPIESGETLLVASNVLRFGAALRNQDLRFDPNQMIDDLQHIIGENGTLLFPAFNYDFCENKPFDYKNTPPKNMGTLSNIAFKRHDFIRTKHPVFSFLVSLRGKNEYYALENISGFGLDSPFALLHAQKAKMLFIDIEYNRSFTFIHYVEEQVGVAYRYHKNFTSFYIDAQGQQQERTYSLLVRDLERGVENASNPIGAILEQKGIAKISTLLGVNFIVVDLENAYKVIQNDIIYNGAKNLIAYAI